MESNYHYEDGVCLPRSTIYEHYQDYCQRAQIQPVNAASFGKIIRQQFPTLTTRRLGTRGQSKYHYYGLGIKPISRYYKKELIEEQSSASTKKDVELKKEKPSAILSSFPDINLLKVPETLHKDKLHTFMVMYKTHCQRILDSVVRANFVEVENFLTHFWQGIPTHLLPVLATSVVVDLVAFCDSLLYGVIRDVLIVSPLKSCPESLALEMVKFSSTLVTWLRVALKGLPESLQSAKYKLASNFARSLKRQTQLMNLAQAARNALHGEDSLMQLRKDWNMMDLQLILANTLFALERKQISMEYLSLIPHFLQEFAELIESSTTLEDFTMWADSVVDKCVRNAQNTCDLTLKQLGKVFLLIWKYFTSKVAREFTLQSAPSFGTFHLLHILIDDYIVHTLESAVEEEEELVYKRRIDAIRIVAEKETTLPTRASVYVTLNDKDVSVDHPTSCGMQMHRSLGGLTHGGQNYSSGATFVAPTLPLSLSSRSSSPSLPLISRSPSPRLDTTSLARSSTQSVETANHCKDPCPVSSAGHSLLFKDPCPASSAGHSLLFKDSCPASSAGHSLLFKDPCPASSAGHSLLFKDSCPASSSGHSLSFYVPERNQLQSQENSSMGAAMNKMFSRGFDGCQTMDMCPSSRSVCTANSLLPLGNSLVPSLPVSSTTSSISSLSTAGIPFLPTLPSVPSMYPYGYSGLSGLAGVPTQPLSAGIFQTQSGLSMPGYPYLPPRFLQKY